MANAVAPKSLLRRIFRALFTIPLAVWVFLEDWIWDGMLAFMGWLGKLPPIRWDEAQIAKLPKYVALLAFVLPAAILLP